jgi:osmotically-inducible protein OsmY
VDDDLDDDLRLPVGDKRLDAEIARNAVEGLHDQLPYSSEFINVSIEGGWLTLEGDIEWSYQRDRAEKAVLAVSGVIGVSDNLRRKPRVVVTEVKRQIEDALKRNVELDANRAAVELGDSRATLKGLRSWAILDGFSVHRESVRR